MGGLRGNCKIGIMALVSIWVALIAINGLLKPAPNRCVMTYMYPTYIPIPTPANVLSDKYGLFLYHEGWQQIDFADHLKKINGIPVLFIPGNGGSYKQVRSLAAESYRAYQGGPLEKTFYQETTFLTEGLENFEIPNRYSRNLDWFAVDLEGEHSAMDGRILEEHTEYVVCAIHRILDQYKKSREARGKDGAEASGSLPTSVILVGHSMGGFVARAALIHPLLRQSAVETILTLSSPHQSPPVALQPSLGHFFTHVNGEWRKGYETQNSPGAHSSVSPKLSNVVVISISGGINDYQVRSKLGSLEGIVPLTHGLTLVSSGVKNVWLSMEHQTILWCNQLVVQVSHTLLSLIDPVIGRPFSSTQKRLFVFTKMLQSAIPQALSWSNPTNFPIKDSKNNGPESRKKDSFSCPESVKWAQDGLEKDLYIQSNLVTVLAMDGRRRWLDIRKLGSNGRDHFVFVTNLAPCFGVRIHLWPEKNNSSHTDEMPAGSRILEVTSKMVRIPAGPAPRQVEPGSQTEQPPPSVFLLLSPEEMSGFRFLTISVAPRPSISGRPPPAASMAVGQFFNPKQGETNLSPFSHLHSAYSQKEIYLEENHPLALKLSFSISLGLLPVTLSLKTIGCGIKSSTQKSETEQNSLCKLRCFPPVSLAWDSVSGLHIIPNIYSDTVTVDSSPALLDSSKGSEKTIVLILADPHCSYRVGVSVSITAAASRFFLLYSPQIIGFMISAIFFVLMQQANAWEIDSSVPSVLSALELNLRFPHPFLALSIFPIILSALLSLVSANHLPPFGTFITVTILCYLIANGFLTVLVLISKLVLYSVASLHVLAKRRWQAWQDNIPSRLLNQILRFISLFQSSKIVQIIKGNPNPVIAILTIPLVCFVHPAVGLGLLLLSHVLYSHSSLSSFLAASFRSHTQRKDFTYKSKTEGNDSKSLNLRFKNKANNGSEPLLPTDESNSSNSSDSPTKGKSFSERQLDMFNYRHGILTLHLLATLMFVPSLVAWLQRIGMGQNYPWLVDSALCVGVILHGLFGSTPNFNYISVNLIGREVGLISLLYLIAGYYTFISSMELAPYKSFYAIAVIGVSCFISWVIERRNRERGDLGSRKSRKHSHKH